MPHSAVSPEEQLLHSLSRKNCSESTKSDLSRRRGGCPRKGASSRRRSWNFSQLLRPTGPQSVDPNEASLSTLSSANSSSSSSISMAPEECFPPDPSPASCAKKGCLKFATQVESLGQAFSSSSTSPSTSDSDRTARGVAWGSVTLHSHAIRLGDNVCSSGPPVTIEWVAFESAQLDLEAYESSRPGPSRDKSQMLLPRSVREDLLRNAGYPRSALVAATAQAADDQRRRRRSSNDGRLLATLLKR